MNAPWRACQKIWFHLEHLQEHRQESKLMSLFEFKSESVTVQPFKVIAHDGEVNRARHNPFNKEVVATKTVEGKVFIFDTKNQPDRTADTPCMPDLNLLGAHFDGTLRLQLGETLSRTFQRRLWTQLEYVSRWTPVKRLRRSTHLHLGYQQTTHTAKRASFISTQSQICQHVGCTLPFQL